MPRSDFSSVVWSSCQSKSVQGIWCSSLGDVEGWGKQHWKIVLKSLKLRNRASKKCGITQQNQGLAPYIGLLVSFHHSIPDHLVNGWVLRSCLLNPQFLCVAGKWGLWTVNQPMVTAFVVVVQASAWVIAVMAVRFGLLWGPPAVHSFVFYYSGSSWDPVV